jgi:hypothetical protein
MDIPQSIPRVERFLASCEVLDILREIHGIDDCLCGGIFLWIYSHIETMNDRLCRQGKAANSTARFNQSLLNSRRAGIGKEVESWLLDPHGVSILSI